MIQNSPLQQGSHSDRAKILYRFFILPVLVFMFLSGCEEESSFLGLEIQPPSDRLAVRYFESNEVKAFTFTVDSSDANQVGYQLLGDLNDPVTGVTQADFFTQFSYTSFGTDLGTSPVADSLFLSLHVVGIYGDRDVSQDIKVYEITQDLRNDSIYYSNLDPAEYFQPGAEIATFSYDPSENDTLIKIPISDAGFIQKIFDMDSLTRSNYLDFIKYFKGFYITSERQGDPGSILRLDLLSTNSRMTLHYKNAENDSLTLTFAFGIESKRINLFRHDFTGTDFYSSLNQTEIQDSVVFVKSMSGLTAKLQFPDMLQWRDSMPVAINKARLILPVEVLDATTDLYPLPVQLMLLIKNEQDEFATFTDYDIGTGYFGGTYDPDLQAYAFNVSNQVQQFITGKVDALEFYVLVQNNSTAADRVVLTTGNHTRPIKLQITYHKY
jgi:hypothetical protein